ncbi:MAG: hypothetical protein GC201_01720 [Alphaproteobacteria bacterium]|nr:hypothetical protein [Alphaproteobacteria bacterium]
MHVMNEERTNPLRQLMQLQQAGPGMWSFPVTARVASRRGNFWGGAGLAGGIEAMETETGRPLIWATAHFISTAKPPAVMTMSVEELARGGSISQARATLRDGDSLVAIVDAALGARDGSRDAVWLHRPDVPPPGACAPVPGFAQRAGRITDEMEFRTVDGRFGPASDAAAAATGRVRVWGRMISAPVTAGAIAIMADCLPSVMYDLFGDFAGVSSLDNTVRMVSRAPSAWLLFEFGLAGLGAGIGHGQTRIWNETGDLIALAGQSFVARFQRKE